MGIDIERLKVDREYWDSVAPEGMTHYCTESTAGFCKPIRPRKRCCIPRPAKPEPEDACPQCGGEPDNGYDRSWPDPQPYVCSKCEKGESQEWVDGLPPVGCECEISTEYGYLPCRIVAHGHDGDGYAVGHLYQNGYSLKVDWSRTGFRPIRTKEQLERQDLHRAIENAYPRVEITPDHVVKIADAIIAAGWRKTQ